MLDAPKDSPPDLNVRYCPGCKFVITTEETLLSLHNFTCPRCRQHRLSDFESPKPRGSI